MKNALRFAAKATLNGFLIVVPIYLAVLLLLKAIGSIAKLVRPFTLILPEWLPAENSSPFSSSSCCALRLALPSVLGWGGRSAIA